MNALLVDIGNSRVKGRLLDTRTGRTVDLPATLEDRVAEDWATLAAAVVDVAYLSNVASTVTEAAFVDWLSVVVPAVRIERVVAEARTGDVVNGYRQPQRLGADRWMAMIGAHALLPRRSLLVCGFGTATTLDLLLDDPTSDDVTFAGGVILPGADAMRAVLSERTARLGVGHGEVVEFADNTEDAITSGVTLAQRGAWHEAWQAAKRHAPGRLECVVAGGAGASIVRFLDTTDVVVHHLPDLVLRGLAVIATAAIAVDAVAAANT